MSTGSAPEHAIKEPKGLSKRIQWLRDYYFQGTERAWNNEYTSWTTGTPWDIINNEMTFYIVPETYTLLTTLGASYLQAAGRLPCRRFLAVAQSSASRLVCQRSHRQLCAAGNACRAICWPAPI